MRNMFDQEWNVIEIVLMDSYTRSQLALRNGQDREEIWIAYRGIIYDASPSRHWRKGLHYGHWSGQDLTEELKDAPHAEEVFKRLQVVGTLIEPWLVWKKPDKT